MKTKFVVFMLLAVLLVGCATSHTSVLPPNGDTEFVLEFSGERRETIVTVDTDNGTFTFDVDSDMRWFYDRAEGQAEYISIKWESGSVYWADFHLLESKKPQSMDTE